MKHMYTICITVCDNSLMHLGPVVHIIKNTTNGTRSKSSERTLKVVSDRFMFWPLKCVEVEDLVRSDILTIRGTPEKTSQTFGQYSGSGCNFPMMD